MKVLGEQIGILNSAQCLMEGLGSRLRGGEGGSLVKILGRNISGRKDSQCQSSKRRGLACLVSTRSPARLDGITKGQSRRYQIREVTQDLKNKRQDNGLIGESGCRTIHTFIKYVR